MISLCVMLLLKGEMKCHDVAHFNPKNYRKCRGAMIELTSQTKYIYKCEVRK
jgi:hypothetical protein